MVIKLEISKGVRGKKEVGDTKMPDFQGVLHMAVESHLVAQ